MFGDFSCLSRRAVRVAALPFFLVGCAHRYTVSAAVERTRQPRAEIRAHDRQAKSGDPGDVD
jgi:hypothetical protein